MKKFLRWPVAAMFALLVIAIVASTITFSHTKPLFARAAGSPTLSLPGTIRPFVRIPVTAQGFHAGDTVDIGIDQPYDSSNPFTHVGGLSCDSNGACTGVMYISYYPLGTNVVPQGIHTIFATGQSGLSTQVKVNMNPGLLLTSTQSTPVGVFPAMREGGPGAAFQVMGAGFKIDEAVTLYWGLNKSSQLGVATTDSNGSFQVPVTAPTGIMPGTYPVIAVRTHQIPASVKTSFHIRAPNMVSSAGVLISHPIRVQLSGFQANEQVAISWNANNGQTLTTIQVDNTGAVKTTFPALSAPKGAYILTATGNSSGLQTTSNISIGPGLLLDPSTANIGSAINVNGGGYTPGETVNVYFEKTSNGVTSATVSSQGDFNVQLTVPSTFKSGKNYSVYAVSTSGTESAIAKFAFVPPSIQFDDNTQYAYGTPYTLDGQGFAPSESIALIWQYQGQQTPVQLGTITAASDGTFTFTSIMPSVPYNLAVTITAQGNTSKLIATRTIGDSANIIPTPEAATIGSTVSLQGGSFGSNETVTITLQGGPQTIQLAPTTTDATGAFVTTFTVPDFATVNMVLEARGSTSLALVDVTFNAIPTVTITPQSGPSGTAITVSGKGFDSYNNITIYWSDPSTNAKIQLSSLYITSNSFQQVVNAPSNLTSGNTYDVLVVDAYSGATITLPFIAQ